MLCIYIIYIVLCLCLQMLIEKLEKNKSMSTEEKGKIMKVINSVHFINT